MHVILLALRSTIRVSLRCLTPVRPSLITALLYTLLSPERLYAGQPATGSERTFPLPILSVDQKFNGHCARPRFSFRRTADDTAPLSLAVSEDTPGGAGDSVRASMWLAAMVAALDRMDPLAGTSVSLQLSGNVDGPSAGAGLCLAIFSALDGRDFPADCAVTGAIMPDGTVGAVGGIAPKLRAAAAAGLRRVVIPANIRFEKQPGVAEEIDLKRLAAELKLELLLVENVTQGYAALHGLPPTPRAPPSRSVLELPERTEEALKRRYRLHYEAGAAIWNTIPEADKQHFATDPFTKSIFVDPELAAENAYRTGRLGRAAGQACRWHLALDARKKHLEGPAKQKPQDAMSRDSIETNARMQERVAEITAGLSGPATLLASPTTGSESGAQTWSDLNEIAGLAGIVDFFQAEVDRKIGEAQRPDLKDDELKALRQEVFERRQTQLLLMRIAAERLRGCLQEREAVTATIPPRPVVERPEGIERLFYNAHLAVRNTFRHDVVGAFAAQTQQSPSQTLDNFKGLDILLTMYEPAAVAAEGFHGQAIAMKDARLQRYALAVSAHLQAEALATQSALIVRWNHLETDLDEQGSLVYRRTDLLNYLISTARENALSALAQCREKDLVAVSPITRFEAAEMLRDDIATDKVEVLAAYWSASLQAKVLLMLCGSTKNSPLPAASESPTGTNQETPVEKGRSTLDFTPYDLRGLGIRLPSTEELLKVPRPRPIGSLPSTAPVSPVTSTGGAAVIPSAFRPKASRNPLFDAFWPVHEKDGLNKNPAARKWPWATLVAAWLFWQMFAKKSTNPSK